MAHSMPSFPARATGAHRHRILTSGQIEETPHEKRARENGPFLFVLTAVYLM